MSNGETANPDDQTAEDEIEGEAAPKGLKAKLAGKMKFILAGVGMVILLGAGAGLYFSGIFHTEKPHEVTVNLPDPPVFHDIARITVDLQPSPGRAKPFIRLSMQAELQGESARAVFIEKEPKIMDTLQTHLRTVTVEDLHGQEGTERLREDLTQIINRIIAPEVCIAVLYKEILVR